MMKIVTAVARVFQQLLVSHFNYAFDGLKSDLTLM